MSFLFRDYWRYMPTRLKMMLFWLRKAAKRRLADDQSPGDDNLSPKVLLDLEKHFSKAKDGSETVSDWQAVLDSVVHDLIEQRETAGVNTVDVLSRLIETRDTVTDPRREPW